MLQNVHLISTEINSLTINKEPDRKKIPQRILSDPVLWLVYSFIRFKRISYLTFLILRLPVTAAPAVKASTAAAM